MHIFLKIPILALPNLRPIKNFILTKKCEKKVNVRSNYGVHKVENAECTQLRNFLHNGRVRVKYAKFINFTPLYFRVFFLEKVVCPLSVPQTDEPLGLTEIKFQIFRTFEFSPGSESSIRESYVFRRSTCAGHNVKEKANVVRDSYGCDMRCCGCEMRMGASCCGCEMRES